MRSTVPRAHTSYTGTDETALAVCESANASLRVGDYQEALRTIWPYWRGRNTIPNTKSLGLKASAELFWVVGKLQSAIEPSAISQRLSRRFVRRAARTFAEIADKDGLGRCRKDVALSYWREGRFQAARRELRRAFTDKAYYEYSTELAIYLMLAIVERGDGQLDTALALLSEAAPLVKAVNDDDLCGSFHITHALVLDTLGDRDGLSEYKQRAFIELTAAGFYFEQAGKVSSVARVENNLALLHLHFGNYKKAHSHIDHALELTNAANDEVYAAWHCETRARILAAEGRFDEALYTIGYAIAELERLQAAEFLMRASSTRKEIEASRLAYLKSVPNVLPLTPPLAPLPARFTLRISDDSLQGADIAEGDVVIFDRDTEPMDGDLVAAQTVDGLLVRFFYGQGEEVELVAAHPEVESRPYPACHVRVRGVALRR